jgi:peroxin-7
MPGQNINNPRPTFPPSEALTHDWNKYRNTIIATAGVDQIIRTFDIRNPKGGAVALLRGHDYAVRRLAWSPHLSDVLLSASYDMTSRVWTDGSAIGQQQPAYPNVASGGRELGRMNRHTEFVMGVDWCLFGSEGWVASTGWDQRLCVWDVRTVMGP